MNKMSSGAKITLVEMRSIVREYLLTLGVPYSNIVLRDIGTHAFELVVPIWGVRTPDGANFLRLNETYENPSDRHDPHGIQEKVNSSACFFESVTKAVGAPHKFSNKTQLIDFLSRFIKFNQASTSEILDKQREITEQLKVMDGKLDSILAFPTQFHSTGI